MDIKETVTVNTYKGNTQVYAEIIVTHDATGSSNGIDISLDAYNQLRDHFLRESQKSSTRDEALPIGSVVGSLPPTKTCKVIPDNDEMFSCDVTDCCGVGPIVREKYCPECGSRILRRLN